MATTKLGGVKAAATNKKKYGGDFYHRIGAMGGKAAPGPFRANRELARLAGRKGGRISRRGPNKKTMPFVPDDKPFSDGFGQPNLSDRIKRNLGVGR